MDLTYQYLLWRFGILDRPEIIGLVDAEILKIPRPPEELLNLSLSNTADELVFADLMHPFINEKQFTAETLLPIVTAAVRKTSPTSAGKLFDGLSWFVYALGNQRVDSPINDLFYRLDHLLTHDIPDKFATTDDIAELFSKWLQERDMTEHA